MSKCQRYEKEICTLRKEAAQKEVNMEALCGALDEAHSLELDKQQMARDMAEDMEEKHGAIDRRAQQLQGGARAGA